MIADLQPYPEYKESGLPWLGRVPSHWTLRRNGGLFTQRNETGFPDLPILEVSINSGVRVRDVRGGARKQFMSDRRKYKRALTGDIAYNMMRMWQGAAGCVPVDGLVSPAYVVARPLPGTDSRYFELLLRTPAYKAEINGFSRGIVSDRNRLYWVDFKQLSSPLPPCEEQEAIVRFLEYVNWRIERYLRAKKTELALVSEMLLNVTQRTLQLPAAKTIRLSAAVEVMSRPVERRTGQSYTPIGLYNRGRGIFHKASTDGAELGDSDFTWVEDGDLVISGQFAWEGAVALARAKDAGCVASHRYPILRGRKQYVTSPFLLALLRTPYGTMLLDQHSRGAAGRNRPLNVRSLLKEKVPIPPLSAQARILELLNQEHSVAQSLAKAVRYVNEYRARLVTDVVTGMLDVRSAVCLLPAEPVELTPDLADEGELETNEEVTSE